MKHLTTIILCTLIASCASTSLVDNWKKPELTKSYAHPMIIGISDSQQTRRIYENHFVAELARKKITATPSYYLINSKQTISRETVTSAIQNTDIEIDSVLVTYLVSSDTETRYVDSPLNNSYSGSPDDNMISATLISNRDRASSNEVIGLKHDLYDIKTRSLVWSVQTRTESPESIDFVITRVTQLVIKRLLDDNMLKIE